MILVDTTILVYAVGAEHPLREPCRELVGLVRDGRVRARTTVEAVQEFAHVRARRRSRADAAARARDYVRGLSPLARPGEDELLDGLGLFETSARLGPFDAVLAACARRWGWAIASADRSFGEVKGVTHLDPSSPDFLHMALAAG